MRKGSFHLFASGDIGFTVESYDHTRPLVIDPVLLFSTYLTSQSNDAGYLAADSSGNNYLAGTTDLGFPQTPGAFPGCSTCTANQAVTYVSKLSADGKTLVYSTLLGGNNYTQAYSIAADSSGNALVAGRTEATDFPTKNGQPVGTGGNAITFGFLASLSADGSTLNYSTLLGGMSPAGDGTNTSVAAVAVDRRRQCLRDRRHQCQPLPFDPGCTQQRAARRLLFARLSVEIQSGRRTAVQRVFWGIRYRLARAPAGLPGPGR